MAEYIKREAAIKAIDNEVSFDGLYANIKAIPAADVRPERHGHWDDSDGEHIKCSKCGQFAPIVPQYQDEPITYEAPFCPNCGAKMDGKDVTQ